MPNHEHVGELEPNEQQTSQTEIQTQETERSESIQNAPTNNEQNVESPETSIPMLRRSSHSSKRPDKYNDFVME